MIQNKRRNQRYNRLRKRSSKKNKKCLFQKEIQLWDWTLKKLHKKQSRKRIPKIKITNTKQNHQENSNFLFHLQDFSLLEKEQFHHKLINKMKKFMMMKTKKSLSKFLQTVKFFWATKKSMVNKRNLLNRVHQQKYISKCI